ncbi:MAG: Mur ligase domain-containing protein, partial [Candidatus Uhrbacteria bacterium]|nr:Mur ligase domain-containing protein [Candidatus Uhrbacteria bacterium]
MMKPIQHAHLVGIGGINMSGLAKLLVRAGIHVSGSDTTASLLTKELLRKGIKVQIGHKAEHLPPETDLVIYSSAVPEQNFERAEARRRNIDQKNNFQFLGEWTREHRTLVVCGTHGKSTTTALLGLMLIQAGKDPTVVVGSRVPSFPEGNVRFGQSDLFVIEGDEYEKHFLEFYPNAVILNNIELDHTDIFSDVAAMSETFRQFLHQVKDGGLVVANADDPRVGTLIG